MMHEIAERFFLVCKATTISGSCGVCDDAKPPQGGEGDLLCVCVVIGDTEAAGAKQGSNGGLKVWEKERGRTCHLW